MNRLPYLILSISLFTPTLALAESGAIASAESAGPASVSKNATIKDWNMNVLRKGTNGPTPKKGRKLGTGRRSPRSRKSVRRATWSVYLSRGCPVFLPSVTLPFWL